MTAATAAGRPGIPERATIVDSHVHVWPPGLVHPAQASTEPLAASPAALLSTLAAGAVDVALASPAMVYPHNEYVLGAASTAPERLFAVVGVDPREPDAVASIGPHARSGAIAVRVNLGATPLDDEAGLAGLDALAAATAEQDLVLQWTMRLPSAGLIERVAARHPELRQVFDHLGLPVDVADRDQLACMRDLAGIDQLHVKLPGMYALSSQGYPYEDVWPWIEAVVEAFGPDRTLWASDWPLSLESAPHADLLALVHRLPFLDEPARASILGGTARRLWPAAA